MHTVALTTLEICNSIAVGRPHTHICMGHHGHGWLGSGRRPYQESPPSHQSAAIFWTLFAKFPPVAATHTLWLPQKRFSWLGIFLPDLASGRLANAWVVDRRVGRAWQRAARRLWAGSSLLDPLLLLLLLDPPAHPRPYRQWRCPAPRYLLSRTQAVAMEASMRGERSGCDDP